MLDILKMQDLCDKQKKLKLIYIAVKHLRQSILRK